MQTECRRYPYGQRDGVESTKPYQEYSSKKRAMEIACERLDS